MMPPAWARVHARPALLPVLALVALAGCTDLDLRGNLSGAFDTSDSVRVLAAPRPEPDGRGIISYPGYQVAVARRGDTVADVAARAGVSAQEIARFNGIPDGSILRDGEVLALPTRVAEPSPATGAEGLGPIRPADSVDIATLASPAIDRAEAAGRGSAPERVTTKPLTGKEPVRHKVERGETAYSVARLYGVPLRALADWNGLSSEYALREGQFLLIPVADTAAPAPSRTAAPGAGSRAPEPPSAARPLPKAAQAPVAAPASPQLDRFASGGDDAAMLRPVEGRILRDFRKGRNDGIDIAAPGGTPVRAAAAGTVAAVTRDTDGVPILVLRHADGLLTVYAGLDALSVKKDDKVSRGQQLAQVRAGDPAFLHFEVRKGLEAVDPTPYLTP
jgi:murein DD-endopeptidase MepM/ murein hydrolase activator NlpD